MSPRLRLAFVGSVLAALFALAGISLIYGAKTALRDSADLERRAREVVLFRNGDDPYMLRDEVVTSPQDAPIFTMTYPPSAPPVFTALVPVGSSVVRRVTWIGLNVAALAIFCGLIVRQWGKSWPIAVQAAFVLAVFASKPGRAGIALGQFHLIPLALIVAAEILKERRIAAGIAVGLALVKPTMSLPYLIVLAVRRRFLALFTAVFVQGVLTAAVSVWLKRSPWALVGEWLRNAKAQTTFGTIDLPSLLGRAVPALANYAFPITGLVLILTLGLLAKFRDRSRLGLLALSSFAAAVMTYHRHYDLVLLLPALAYLVDAAVKQRPGMTVWAGGFGLLLIVPSDRKFLGERLESVYDIVFAIVCYATLVVLICEVARELPRREEQ